MESLDDDFIARLEAKLKCLPLWSDKVEREDHWMTAEQIKGWSGTIYSPEEIDVFLCDRWQSGQLKNIRPAKHPHSSKLVTLWGHIERVWPIGPGKEIELSRLDEPIELAFLDLPVNAPQIFISFSSFDSDLAKQLRNQLGEKGFRSWLYISEINKDTQIFNNVNSGIKNCMAFIGLITQSSIGSAWVTTELTSAIKSGKLIFAVFDANDSELMRLLTSWSPGKSIQYDSPLIQDLFSAYSNKVIKHTEKGHIEHNEVGYKRTTADLLFTISDYSRRVFYPKRPDGWNGSDNFIDFGALVEELLLLKVI